MSGGGSTTQTSNNINSATNQNTSSDVSKTSDVWAPAKSYITDLLSSAQNVYNTSGSAVAPQSANTQAGQNFITNTAYQNVGRYNPTLATAMGMSSSGSGLTSDYNQPMGVLGNVSSGQNAINTGGLYGNVASKAGGISDKATGYADTMGPTAASQYLTGMASGADAGKDPYLMQMIADREARTANRVGSTVAGMGRYGSGGHADVLGRSLAEATNPLLSSAYESDKARQLAASGQIDTSQRALDASKQGALGLGLTGLGTQQNAITGQTGVQGQNISNQLGASNNQISALNTGQQNAINWANLLPTLNSLQYDAGNRLTGVGSSQDTYAQSQTDSPWTQLSRYSGTLSGLGNLFANAGTTTGSTTGTNTGTTTGTTSGTSNTQKQYGILDYLNSISGLLGGGSNSAAATGLGILGL